MSNINTGIRKIGTPPEQYSQSYFGQVVGKLNQILPLLAGSESTSSSTLLTGTTAPGEKTGNIGDVYLDTANFYVYGPKTSSGWGSGTSLVGPQGPTGPTGPTGPSGSTTGGVIISATSNPFGTSTNGNFWLNTKTFVLFGPYYHGWPTNGFSISGETISTTLSYTVVPGDEVVLADATGGPINITLPAIPSINQSVEVVKVDSTVNAVNIASGIAIYGSVSITIQGTAIAVRYNGTNWNII